MTAYRLYVFLLDIAPPIWRRVGLSSETSLAQLHKVIRQRWDGRTTICMSSRSAANATGYPTPIPICPQKSLDVKFQQVVHSI